MSGVHDSQGHRIKSARLSAGLTQSQLARAVETSERNIQRWENDQNAPRFAHVVAIAKATGKDVGFFTLTSPPATEEVAPAGGQFRNGDRADVRDGDATGRGARVRKSARSPEGPPVKDAA